MWKLFMAAMLLPSILLLSCQKSATSLQEQTVSGQGIVGQLDGMSVGMKNAEGSQSRNTTPRQASFQLLSFAIAKAGLADDLNDPKFAYTLFAPSDEAFAAIGFASREAINGVPKEKLKSILLYHVLASKVLAAQVPTSYTELTMLNN